MLSVKPPSSAAPDPPADPGAESAVPDAPAAAPAVSAESACAPGDSPWEAALPTDAVAEAPAHPAYPDYVDPAHWLYRLTAEQWLSAAVNELQRAYQALLAKQQRAGVTYARRSAGMALNARLRHTPCAAYGRSYMEHLQALRVDAAVSPELSDAAGRLLAAPTTQQLVTLGPRGDTTAAELAERIIESVRQQLASASHCPAP